MIKQNGRRISIAIGLLLGISIGSFGTPAEAFNRRVQTGSSRGFDETGINELFTLVTVDTDASSILDSSPDSDSVGYFSRAVADYASFSPAVSSDLLSGSLGGPGIIDTVSSFDGLLEALENEGIMTTNLGPLDLRAAKLTDGIRYSFIDSDIGSSVLDLDIPVNSPNGPALSSFSESDREKLVNDLPFIVDNFEWRFVVEGSSSTQSLLSEATFIENIPDPVETPEPSAVGGLLALAIAGISFANSKSRSRESLFDTV